MTQKEADILVEIIKKVVRNEFNLFKKQLLQEGFKPNTTPQTVTKPVNRLAEVQKKFRNEYHVQNKPTKRLSADPMLNSLLMETEPIKEDDTLMEELTTMGINIPTDGMGRPMSSSGNVAHVLDAMNKDYSGMFTPKTTKQPTTNQPINISKERERLRSNFMSIMEMSIMEGDLPPDNLDYADEDFSFLDRVS